MPGGGCGVWDKVPKTNFFTTPFVVWEELPVSLHPLQQVLPLVVLHGEEGGIVRDEGTTSFCSIIADLNSSDELFHLHVVIIVIPAVRVLLEEGWLGSQELEQQVAHGSQQVN